MAYLMCPICKEKRSPWQYIEVDCNHNASLRGIVTCLICNHEWPITIMNSVIHKVDTGLPGVQSTKLSQIVPPDIKEDIKEAERANYSQCFRAAAAMCRRAIQMALIDKGIADKQLGNMLNEAYKLKHLLTERTYSLAINIKGYGDIAVHHAEQLEHEDVNIAIKFAVDMLNEIYSKK